MVRTGLDRLLDRNDIIRNRRMGLIANHTSVNADLRYSWDLLAEAGADLQIIFSPEHGLFGIEQDQEPVSEAPPLSHRVESLYGDSVVTLAPFEEHLAELDAVFFDIQDVGSRYYTYVNTMVLFMRALHGRGIEFIVLDRPNPLGGLVVEGPGIREGYESFVGILPVPVRHGLTPGEMARMALSKFKIDLELTVIEMEGWDRSMYFDDTGIPWVPPSPNMPTLSTAMVYPGACLFEGTTVSEGRGTTTPFEVIGAPGVSPLDLARELDGLPLPGVRFRPVWYRPGFNKHCGKTAGGVFIHVTDRKIFRPFATGVALVSVFHGLYPGFEFTRGVYEFNSKHPAFDLLTGGMCIRNMIEEGVPVVRILDSWGEEEDIAAETMREFHMYGDS
ncbi:MAG: DUF1343 domain-containing protein [Spirochaetes bacterium]|nr:DUF1343 domain-containing protein [Spirochaetota bacterium]